MNKTEYQILELFSDKGHAMSIGQISLITGKPDTVIGPMLSDFHRLGYITTLNDSPLIAVDTDFFLTYRGEKAIETYRQKCIRHFWIEFRAWFTLAIALAAFVKSFFY